MFDHKTYNVVYRKRKKEDGWLRTSLYCNPELVAEVEAFRSEKSISRNAAIIWLIKKGLVAYGKEKEKETTPTPNLGVGRY